MKKRAVGLLQKEITEQGCTEEKWQMLYDLLNTRLQATPVPPPGIVFDDSGGAVDNGGTATQVRTGQDVVQGTGG